MHLRHSLFFLALIVLHQFARSQRMRTHRRQATWGGWTMWSMCTTSRDDGVRIRSRACSEKSCNNLPGKNYEIQTCSIQAMPEKVQNKSYLEKCTNDPNMNGTLSCRLYRENPMMAYGIFRSAGHMHCDNHNEKSSGKQRSSCMFNMIGNSPDIKEAKKVGADQQELVFDRLSRARSNEMDQYINQLDGTPLFSEYFSENGIKKESQQPSPAQNALTDKICTATCEKLVLQGSQVSQLGKNAPSSIQELLQFLTENIFLFRDNTATILDEFNSCRNTCRGSSNPAEYTKFRDILVKLKMDPTQRNSGLIVSTIQPSNDIKTSRTRRNAIGKNVSYPEYPDLHLHLNLSAVHSMQAMLVKRTLQLNNETTPSLYRLIQQYKRYLSKPKPQSRGRFVSLKLPSPTKPSAISIQLETSNHTDKRKAGYWTTEPSVTKSMPTKKTVLRYKRQVNPSRPNPDNFISPCFERVEVTGNPRVLNLDNSEGELFFYEGREQRFIRKRCVGRSLVPGKLYRAQEPVRQERTQKLAVCKQGYLVRYGLIIQLDRKGEFAFNDGEKFSIRFRPFMLESHCALSVVN